jgi:hypothetical protein
MKLISILLHTCLSLLAVAAELSPDIMARSAGITTYTVTPVDRANIYETEALLKDTYGDSNLITERHNGIFISWKVTSSDSQLAGKIEALAGVLKVESDHDPRSQDRHTLQARDAGRYMVAPKEGADAQKTEEYLKTQIQPDTRIQTVMAHGAILAWFNVWLSPEAKQAVENHEGVDEVSDDSEISRHNDEDTLPSEVEYNAHLPRTTVQHGDLSSQQAREELDRRDGEFKRYQAFANETVDIGKTEEFLKTKVQKGKTVQPMLRWRDKKLIGWTNIVLDAAALKEVQDHEGIKSITMEQKIAPLRATPPHKAYQSQDHTTTMTGLLGKMWKLARRGLKWVKQSKADKALVMNSQYK